MYIRLPVWAPSAGGRSAVPRGAQGGDGRRDRRDRRRLRHGRRALRRGWLRRDRAAVLATRRSCAASCRRRPTSAPTYGGSFVNRARMMVEIVAAVRGVIGNRLALGVRICGDELIEGGTTHRRRRRGRAAGRGDGPGRLHQHVDRGRDGEPVHDRGEHAHPARVRDVHPVRDPQGRRPAGGRRRPLQGSAAGRARPGRGPLRPRRRRPRADRRCRLRGEGARPVPPTRSACACRATRSASGGWGSTAGSGCIENPQHRREAEHDGATGRSAEAQVVLQRDERSVSDRLACRPRSPPTPHGHQVTVTSSRRKPAVRFGSRRRCRTGPSSVT